MLVPLAEDVIEANLSTMTDDFELIMDDHLAPLEIQARLAALGFKQTPTYALVEIRHQQFGPSSKAASA